MPTKVIMPQLGESVEEGTVSKWLKTVGDPVEEFEALLEVNTDKVDTEIPSPAAGVLLATQAEEGAVVAAGSILAWIGQPGEEIPVNDILEVGATAETSPIPGESVSQPTVVEADGSANISPMRAVKPGRHPELGFISPVVARIASENEVDLTNIRGTGKDGRITKHDLYDHLQSGSSASETSQVAISTGTDEEKIHAGEILPLSPVRRAIAEHMVHSKHTSPHVTTVMEVDLSRVFAHRSGNRGKFSRDGVKLTFTPYFIAASVEALKSYPIVNSSWSEAGIQLHRDINIGMATSLGEEGLIVPVIKNVDVLSLFGLARSVNDLAKRARTKKLQPDEVQGGTFTITNHGTSGSLFATPIINQPQCGILGVGAIQKRVVVISDAELGDTIAVRPMVYLTLTFDHRILDGTTGDYFLAKIVEQLTNWK